VVLVQEQERRFFAAVGPFPARVDFVVDDPVVDASVFAVGPRPTLGDQVEDGSIERNPLGGGDVRHGEDTLLDRVRVTEQPDQWLGGFRGIRN